ncbi:DUF4082 domain-containing protein [Actinosynnema sp. NPDC053489]|uniref:DUF4082 domain-containing protein n=1 Tax=Actinosynnema sp. NPDC053489 TaxID=3363916 RepID=UPI0037CB7BD3
MPRLARALVAASLVAGSVVGSAGTAAAGPYTPLVNLFTPTPGAHVQVGVPLLISGSSQYGETGYSEWAEISFDGGATWDYVDLPRPSLNWQYTYTPTVEGDLSITTRAHLGDDTGPPMTTVVHVGGPSTARPLLCTTGCKPFIANVYATADDDPQPVELGLTFEVDLPGRISRVEVQRPGAPATPVRVRLWTSTGAVLADVTSVPAFGREVSLPQDARVVPGERYVVSYWTAGLPYRSAQWQFSGEVVSAPFRLPVAAGVYNYDGGFPTDSWHDSSYGITPVFSG